MKFPLHAASLMLGFMTCLSLTAIADSSASDRGVAGGQQPAYLVVSWNVLHPDQVQPFVDAALPLAQKAGLQLLASADPQVLEGTWPYKGTVIVQRYSSMRALLDFWNSPLHSEAKKLREGHIQTNFVIAIENKE